MGTMQAWTRNEPSPINSPIRGPIHGDFAT